MKRLVVCCDGTWNRPDEKSPTNVAKIALAVADRGEDDAPQLVLYHRGLGTDRLERIRGGAFGLGLSRHVRDCYRFIVTHFEPGDELFLFGFSRGAYTARSTVGLIRNAGVLRPEYRDRIDDAYSLYRGGGDARRPNGIESTLFRRSFSYDDVAVRFVGVWDTVGAVGIPGVPQRLAGRLWTFHDTQLSSAVERAFQALAIDERRRPFAPALWYRKPGDAQILEQRWFAGVHSDIGGGYEDCSLAEISLLWMSAKARESGLGFKPDHLVRAPAPDGEARRLGTQVRPDPDGELHDSYTLAYRLLPPLRRPLADPNKPAGGVAVASSAAARRDYSPANLAAYRDAGGPVCPGHS
jgi:uncharacterized protein (DUF2235 family)